MEAHTCQINRFMRGDTVEGCRTGNMVMSAGRAVSTIKALFVSTQLLGQNPPPLNPAVTASALSGFVFYSHFERLDILLGSPLTSVEVLNVWFAADSPCF